MFREGMKKMKLNDPIGQKLESHHSSQWCKLESCILTNSKLKRENLLLLKILRRRELEFLRPRHATVGKQNGGGGEGS